MSAWIDSRKASDGNRYDVRYRIGGRVYKPQRAGTFRSRKDAVLRRDMVRGWLAQGRDPAVELNALLPSVSREKTIGELWPGWVGSLRDVGEDRKRTIGNAWQHIDPVLGHMTVKAVTVEDGLRLVRSLEKSVAPSTLKLYYGAAKQFMDAQTGENPLRSKLIRLPRVEAEEVVAMSYQQWTALRAQMSKTPFALALDFMEATGVRIGDAAQMILGDLDFFEGKVRVSRARGKSQRSRWVPVPMPILEQIRDRGLMPDDLVFPELAVKDKMRKAMKAACVKADIPHFHPHDLRHRRPSLWIAQGVPLPDVGLRIGHMDLNTTLSVYAHVVATAEDVWTAADYVGGRR